MAKDRNIKFETTRTKPSRGKGRARASHEAGACPYFEELIVIIVEPNDTPDCEVIGRSVYREAGGSGKAQSEARDRGTGYYEKSVFIVFE